MGKASCNNTEKTLTSMDQTELYCSLQSNSKAHLVGLDSHQHTEGRKQVVHREVRKAEVGRFLGAQRGGERQQLGHPDTT